MGNKVNLIEEIRNRIQTAIDSGILQNLVKRISIVPPSETRKFNDYPIINLWLSTGFDEPRYMAHGFIDNMQISGQLICNKLESELNGLYDTATQKGALYIYEKLLNVLDKSTVGIVNLDFNSYANNLRGYSYSVDYDEGLIIINFIIEAETKLFQAGNR